MSTKENRFDRDFKMNQVCKTQNDINKVEYNGKQKVQNRNKVNDCYNVKLISDIRPHTECNIENSSDSYSLNKLDPVNNENIGSSNNIIVEKNYLKLNCEITSDSILSISNDSAQKTLKASNNSLLDQLYESNEQLDDNLVCKKNIESHTKVFNTNSSENNECYDPINKTFKPKYCSPEKNTQSNIVYSNSSESKDHDDTIQIVKRKRGRPRKDSKNNTTVLGQNITSENKEYTDLIYKNLKPKRGRPRKSQERNNTFVESTKNCDDSKLLRKILRKPQEICKSYNQENNNHKDIYKSCGAYSLLGHADHELQWRVNENINNHQEPTGHFYFDEEKMILQYELIENENQKYECQSLKSHVFPAENPIPHIELSFSEGGDPQIFLKDTTSN